MNRILLLSIILIPLLTACGAAETEATETLDQYLTRLEAENGVRFRGISHSRGAYVTPMCYTRTDDGDGTLHNPCYSCHTRGKTPNFYNDALLQKAYSFPESLRDNPFTNLLEDRSAEVMRISDQAVLETVREDNYRDSAGRIRLARELPEQWKGYRPDCHFNFDEQGFDRDPEGRMTGWRAFRYYPFPGTFWPTNGSADDVLIRLPEAFRENTAGQPDRGIYRLNLAIVETLVKQKDIRLEVPANEVDYGIDLDNDGRLATADRVVFRFEPPLRYAGQAGRLLEQGGVHLAPGLFPEGTEFLHSVRYLDWDEQASEVRLAPRMKELRYARKTGWMSYSELERVARAEMYEAEVNDLSQGVLAVFRGNFEEGLNTDSGWVFQGFIEDRQGWLRPQTEEETLYCMGCHSHLGATTDSVFAFPRKFEGIAEDDPLQGWKHWSQKGLAGVPEPRAVYLGVGERHEYSFYLRNNHSGNEFRNNDEVKRKFFDASGAIRSDRLDALHADISLLLLPSRQRALELDKAYRVRVREQNYIRGREANVRPIETLWRRVEPGQGTGIDTPIVRE